MSYNSLMIKQIKSKKIVEVNNIGKLVPGIENTSVVVDLGCGNGKQIYNLAKNDQSKLFIGIDANYKDLEEISAKSLKKKERGGLENLSYIYSGVENLPDELENIANEIQINFPWGSLLEGVIRGEDAILQNICKIAKPNASLVIYLTYDSKFESEFMTDRELPELDFDYLEKNLREKFKAFDIEIENIKILSEEEKAEIQSPWGKKILDKRDREVYRIEGSVHKTLKIKHKKIDLNLKTTPNDVERRTYDFVCFGHPNIKATHFKTLEFTKDIDLTERGDCIVGIKADFELEELKKFDRKVKFICTVDNISSEFKCTVNPKFNSNHEIVLRKSSFESDRTFGFNLNRGANHLDRRILELMTNQSTKMSVKIVEGWY